MIAHSALDYSLETDEPVMMRFYLAILMVGLAAVCAKRQNGKSKGRLGLEV